MIFLLVVWHIHADAAHRLWRFTIHHVRAIQIAIGDPQSRVRLAGPLKGGLGVDVHDAGTLLHGIADAGPNRGYDGGVGGCGRCRWWGSGAGLCVAFVNGLVVFLGGFHLLCLLLATAGDSAGSFHKEKRAGIATAYLVDV